LGVTAGLQTGPRCEARGPLRRKKHFSFYFQILSPQILILTKLEAFSRLDPKLTKLAENFMIFNFAKKSKAKIQIETIFPKIIFKAKFEKILNTRLASKCLLHITKLFIYLNKHIQVLTSINEILNLLKQHLATCLFR
jgi:hypothetical protein